MERLDKVVQWHTGVGYRITVGGVTVTPQVQALVVRFPRGGFVWNRPIAVFVERDGRSERLPVVDVTRRVWLGLLGLTLLVSVIASISARGRS
jgi:hypothetical protein